MVEEEYRVRPRNDRLRRPSAPIRDLAGGEFLFREGSFTPRWRNRR